MAALGFGKKVVLAAMGIATGGGAGEFLQINITVRQGRHDRHVYFKTFLLDMLWQVRHDGLKGEDGLDILDKVD